MVRPENRFIVNVALLLIWVEEDCEDSWIRVEFNILTPCTKASVHCLTNPPVDCISEGELTLLTPCRLDQNGLPSPREK